MTTSALRRAFAAALCALYFSTNVAFSHAAEAGFWAERRDRARRDGGPARTAALPSSPADILRRLPAADRITQAISLPGPLLEGLPKGFIDRHADLLNSLPPQFGGVRKVLPATGAPTGGIVLHIQDVHQNAEAQANIGGLVRALAEKKAAGLVALEGAFAPLDLGSYRAYPNAPAVRAAADALLREGSISGPVHAAMTLAGEVPPWTGVDDKDLHAANVRAYREAAPGAAARKAALAERRTALERRKAAAFNPTLKAFDDAVQSHRDGKAAFSEYVRELSSAAGGARGPAADFLRALEMERSLDFKAVEAERGRLVERLVRALPPERLDELARRSVAHRLGQVRAGDFYRSLRDLCAEAGVPLAGFPAMDAYVRYVLLADGIDGEALLEAADALEAAAYGRLARTAEEKELVAASARLGLAGKLTDFALSPREWARYEKVPDAELSPFEAFYRAARERDRAMADNLLRAMKDSRASTAVLVTGGFHAPGLDERLRAAGLAVVTVVPRIEKVDAAEGASYLSVFSREKTPLDKLFQGEKLFLSPEQWTPKTALRAGAMVGAAEELEDPSRSAGGGAVLKMLSPELEGYSLSTRDVPVENVPGDDVLSGAEVRLKREGADGDVLFAARTLPPDGMEMDEGTAAGPFGDRLGAAAGAGVRWLFRGLGRLAYAVRHRRTAEEERPALQEWLNTQAAANLETPIVVAIALSPAFIARPLARWYVRHYHPPSTPDVQRARLALLEEMVEKARERIVGTLLTLLLVPAAAAALFLAARLTGAPLSTAAAAALVGAIVAAPAPLMRMLRQNVPLHMEVNLRPGGVRMSGLEVAGPPRPEEGEMRVGPDVLFTPEGGEVVLSSLEDVRRLYGGLDVGFMEPHPDDVPLSMGGLAAAVARVARSTVLVGGTTGNGGVTDEYAERLAPEMGEPSLAAVKKRVRVREAKAAAERMGIHRYANLALDPARTKDAGTDHEDGVRKDFKTEYAPISAGALKRLEDFIRREGPKDVWFLPFPFSKRKHHPVHEMTSLAFLAALKDAGFQGRVVFYETHEGTYEGGGADFTTEEVRPNLYCPLSPEAVDDKEAVMRLYGSQVERNPAYATSFRERNAAHAREFNAGRPDAADAPGAVERLLSGRLAVASGSEAAPRLERQSEGARDFHVVASGEFSAESARLVAEEVRRLQREPGKKVKIVFATGNTMKGFLAALASEEGIAWDRVLAFHLDEYKGLSTDHPASFAHFLRENLFSRVPIPPENIRYINGAAPDLEAYRASLGDGADIVMLGIGKNGHLAFNEPGAPFDGVMREVTLTPETVEANRADYPGIVDNPRAYTLGLADVMKGKKVFLLANGEAKAEPVRRAFEEAATTALPASVLQRHPRVTVVLDGEAVSGGRTTTSPVTRQELDRRLVEMGVSVVDGRIHAEDQTISAHPEWFMTGLRPPEDGAIVTDMDRLPDALLLSSLGDLQFVTRSVSAEGVHLGLARVGGEERPVAVKELLRRRPTEAQRRDIRREIIIAQVLGRLGVGPRFHGALRDDEGEVIGYAMQVVPNLRSGITNEDRAEMARRRAAGISTPITLSGVNREDRAEIEKRLKEAGLSSVIGDPHHTGGRTILLNAGATVPSPVDDYPRLRAVLRGDVTSGRRLTMTRGSGYPTPAAALAELSLRDTLGLENTEAALRKSSVQGGDILLFQAAVEHGIELPTQRERLRRVVPRRRETVAGPVTDPFRFPVSIWRIIGKLLQEREAEFPGLYERFKARGLAWVAPDGRVHWIEQDPSFSQEEIRAIWRAVLQALKQANGWRRLPTAAAVRRFVRKNLFFHDRGVLSVDAVRELERLGEIFGVPADGGHPLIRAMTAVYGEAPASVDPADAAAWQVREFIIHSMTEAHFMRDPEKVLMRLAEASPTVAARYQPLRAWLDGVFARTLENSLPETLDGADPSPLRGAPSTAEFLRRLHGMAQAAEEMEGLTLPVPYAGAESLRLKAGDLSPHGMYQEMRAGLRKYRELLAGREPLSAYDAQVLEEELAVVERIIPSPRKPREAWTLPMADYEEMLEGGTSPAFYAAAPDALFIPRRALPLMRRFAIHELFHANSAGFGQQALREGMTEYLTIRAITPGMGPEGVLEEVRVRNERRQDVYYRDEVLACATVALAAGEGPLLEAYLTGDETPMFAALGIAWPKVQRAAARYDRARGESDGAGRAYVMEVVEALDAHRAAAGPGSWFLRSPRWVRNAHWAEPVVTALVVTVAVAVTAALFPEAAKWFWGLKLSGRMIASAVAGGIGAGGVFFVFHFIGRFLETLWAGEGLKAALAAGAAPLRDRHVARLSLLTALVGGAVGAAAGGFGMLGAVDWMLLSAGAGLLIALHAFVHKRINEGRAEEFDAQDPEKADDYMNNFLLLVAAFALAGLGIYSAQEVLVGGRSLFELAPMLWLKGPIVLMNLFFFASLYVVGQSIYALLEAGAGSAGGEALRERERWVLAWSLGLGVATLVACGVGIEAARNLIPPGDLREGWIFDYRHFARFDGAWILVQAALAGVMRLVIDFSPRGKGGGSGPSRGGPRSPPPAAFRVLTPEPEPAGGPPMALMSGDGEIGGGAVALRVVDRGRYPVVLTPLGGGFWSADSGEESRQFEVVPLERLSAEQLRALPASLILSDEQAAYARGQSFRKPRERIVAVLEDEQVLGGYVFEPGEPGTLASIAVDEDHRGTGAVDVLLEDLRANALRGRDEFKSGIIRDSRRAVRGSFHGSLREFRERLGLRSVVEVRDPRRDEALRSAGPGSWFLRSPRWLRNAHWMEPVVTALVVGAVVAAWGGVVLWVLHPVGRFLEALFAGEGRRRSLAAAAAAGRDRHIRGLAVMTAVAGAAVGAAVGGFGFIGPAGWMFWSVISALAVSLQVLYHRELNRGSMVDGYVVVRVTWEGVLATILSFAVVGLGIMALQNLQGDGVVAFRRVWSLCLSVAVSFNPILSIAAAAGVVVSAWELAEEGWRSAGRGRLEEREREYLFYALVMSSLAVLINQLNWTALAALSPADVEGIDAWGHIWAHSAGVFFWSAVQAVFAAVSRLGIVLSPKEPGDEGSGRASDGVGEEVPARYRAADDLLSRVEGLPVAELLRTLRLHEAEFLGERMDSRGLTLHRIRIPAPPETTGPPEGLQILRNELGDTREFDLLYGEGGRLVGIVPVLPPGEEGRAFDLSPYYFTPPSMDDPRLKEKWRAFAEQRVADVAALASRLEEPGMEAVKVYSLGQKPFVYAMIIPGMGVVKHDFDVLDMLQDEPRLLALRRNFSASLGGAVGPEVVFPLFPTVYPTAHKNNFQADNAYLMHVHGVAGEILKPGDAVLVVGVGSGVDAWVAWEGSGRAVTVRGVGINPLEVANFHATARIAGMDAKGVVRDNIDGEPGDPAFDGKAFKLIIANTPTFKSAAVKDERRSLARYWDGTGIDYFRRLARGFVARLHPEGLGVLWGHHAPIGPVFSEAGLETRYLEADEDDFDVYLVRRPPPAAPRIVDEPSPGSQGGAAPPSGGGTWLWGMDLARGVLNVFLRLLGRGPVAAGSRAFSVAWRLLFAGGLENWAADALWRGLELELPAEYAWALFLVPHLFDLFSSRNRRRALPNIVTAIVLSAAGAYFQLPVLSLWGVGLHYLANGLWVLGEVLGVRASWNREEKSLRLSAGSHLWLLHGPEREGVLVDHMGLRERWKVGPFGIEHYQGPYLPRPPPAGGPVYVLGIAGTSHDAAAALYKDGVLVAAQEEERFTRAKHDTSLVPVNAIRWMLKREGITLADLAHVAVARDFNLLRDTARTRAPMMEHLERMHEEFEGRTGSPPDRARHRTLFQDERDRYDERPLLDALSRLAAEQGVDFSRNPPPVSFVPHHLAHAACAYYASGFTEPTLVVTLDGYGDLDTSTVWIGRRGNLRRIDSIKLPHSLGSLWTMMARYLGFTSRQQGELMGFAAHGAPRDEAEESRVRAILSVLDEEITLTPDGGFKVAPEFIFYDLVDGEDRFTRRFIERLGALVPRPAGSAQRLDPERDRAAANLAYALQRKTDEIVLHRARHFLRQDPRTRGIRHMAAAGGVSLNIVSTGKVLAEGLVDGDKLFVPPVPADDGTALGAAMVVSRRFHGLELEGGMTHAYHGSDASDEEIRRTLERFGLVEGRDFERLEGEEAVARYGADRIAEGKVVAWFQGRAELGPRALMNRSLLFNLSDPAANDKANRVKARQPWRPSAISLLDEAAPEVFDGVRSAPFMVVSAPVREDKRGIIHGGIHVDGTTRPQVVTKEANPLAWRLLKILKDEKGVIGVVNTSFNKKEPIVESPAEALNTFYYTPDVDVLVLGPYAVRRPGAWRPSVLSAVDEPEAVRALPQAARTGRAEDWAHVFEGLRRVSAGPHREVLVIGPGRGAEELPLSREMFEGPYRRGMCDFVVSRVRRALEAGGASGVVLGCSSEKMAPVVRDIVLGALSEEERARVSFVADVPLAEPAARPVVEDFLDLERRVARALEEKERIVLFVFGHSGLGKTALSRLIKTYGIAGVSPLEIDAYMEEYAGRPLRPLEVPAEARIVLVEGLFAFREKFDVKDGTLIAGDPDVTALVDIEDWTAKERRVKRRNGSEGQEALRIFGEKIRHFKRGWDVRLKVDDKGSDWTSLRDFLFERAGPSVGSAGVPVRAKPAPRAWNWKTAAALTAASLAVAALAALRALSGDPAWWFAAGLSGAAALLGLVMSAGGAFALRLSEEDLGPPLSDEERGWIERDLRERLQKEFNYESPDVALTGKMGASLALTAREGFGRGDVRIWEGLYRQWRRYRWLQPLLQWIVYYKEAPLLGRVGGQAAAYGSLLWRFLSFQWLDPWLKGAGASPTARAAARGLESLFYNLLLVGGLTALVSSLLPWLVPADAPLAQVLAELPWLKAVPGAALSFFAFMGRHRSPVFWTVDGDLESFRDERARRRILAPLALLSRVLYVAALTWPGAPTLLSDPLAAALLFGLVQAAYDAWIARPLDWPLMMADGDVARAYHKTPALDLGSKGGVKAFRARMDKLAAAGNFRKLLRLFRDAPGLKNGDLGDASTIGDMISGVIKKPRHKALSRLLSSLEDRYAGILEPGEATRAVMTCLEGKSPEALAAEVERLADERKGGKLLRLFRTYAVLRMKDLGSVETVGNIEKGRSKPLSYTLPAVKVARLERAFRRSGLFPAEKVRPALERAFGKLSAEELKAALAKAAAGKNKGEVLRLLRTQAAMAQSRLGNSTLIGKIEKGELPPSPKRLEVIVRTLSDFYRADGRLSAEDVSGALRAAFGRLSREDLMARCEETLSSAETRYDVLLFLCRQVGKELSDLPRVHALRSILARKYDMSYEVYREVSARLGSLYVKDGRLSAEEVASLLGRAFGFPPREELIKRLEKYPGLAGEGKRLEILRTQVGLDQGDVGERDTIRLLESGRRRQKGMSPLVRKEAIRVLRKAYKKDGRLTAEEVGAHLGLLPAEALRERVIDLGLMGRGGRLLELLRTQAGLSQEAMKVRVGTLREVERGERRPTVSFLAQVIVVLRGAYNKEDPRRLGRDDLEQLWGAFGYSYDEIDAALSPGERKALSWGVDAAGEKQAAASPADAEDAARIVRTLRNGGVLSAEDSRTLLLLSRAAPLGVDGFASEARAVNRPFLDRLAADEGRGLARALAAELERRPVPRAALSGLFWASYREAVPAVDAARAAADAPAAAVLVVGRADLPVVADMIKRLEEAAAKDPSRPLKLILAAGEDGVLPALEELARGGGATVLGEADPGAGLDGDYLRSLNKALAAALARLGVDPSRTAVTASADLPWQVSRSELEDLGLLDVLRRALVLVLKDDHPTPVDFRRLLDAAVTALTQA